MGKQALIQLLLRKKINSARTALEAFLSESTIETREAELTAALSEAEEPGDIAAVEEEIVAFNKEKEEFAATKSTLEEEVNKLEEELKEIESKEPKSDDSTALRNKDNKGQIRGGQTNMLTRYKAFAGMQRAQVEELIKRDDVQEFLTRAKTQITEKRSVTGAELLVPTVMLDILRDSINKYSKLISKVNLKPVKGTARQNVAGSVPEGVWTEMVATLNELNFTFSQVEVDGYKVGGFAAIPNSILQDSDIALANEILDGMGQAIGIALDKAILYGTGAKMPVGIVKRLSEAAKPGYYGSTETWSDLRSTNLLVITAEGKSDPTVGDRIFFQDLVRKLGKAKHDKASGSKFWAMSEMTLTELKARGLTFNAAGTIVSGVDGTVPVVGGDAVILNFIPDNVIIGGYGSLYLLAEREGTYLDQSGHVQFIQENTVFKGIARYDGRPVFGEGFVAINISQADLAAAPTANAVTFVTDSANA
jgi:HK97 family phage major capsid protein